MLRRHFMTLCAGLGCCLGWIVTGCRRVDPTSLPIADEPPQELRGKPREIRDRLTAKISAKLQESPGYRMVPLIAFVTLIEGLFYLCKLLSILRQQEAIKRRPHGRVATQMKLKLQKQTLEENPELAATDAADHADAAIRAFADATPAEIESLWNDIQAIPRDEPTLITRARAVEELAGAEE